MGSKREMQDLIESLIEGDISADDHARLTQILKTNPEARRLYINDMKVHGMLKWELRGVNNAADIPDEAPEVVAPAISMTTWIMRAAAVFIFSFLAYTVLTERQPIDPGGIDPETCSANRSTRPFVPFVPGVRFALIILSICSAAAMQSGLVNPAMSCCKFPPRSAVFWWF